MNAPAAIGLLGIACTFVAFMLRAGGRREAPEDEPDPPAPLPEARVHVNNLETK